MPTRDEWEWAARGTAALTYPWGADFDRSRYWPPDGRPRRRPLSVSLFSPPRPGAPCAMASNVREFVSTPAEKGKVYLMGGDYSDHEVPDVTALGFHAIACGKSVRRPWVAGIRCARDADGETPPGMTRIDGGRARLGGETSPAIEFIRKHESEGILVLDLLGAVPGTVHVPAFRIDRQEVSNGAYRMFLAFVRSTGDHGKCHPDEPKGKDHTPFLWQDDSPDELPVVGVDWFDAYGYAAWLGKRLPTDQEWERAARGDTWHVYPWGDTFDAKRMICRESGFAGPEAVVGAFPPTELSPFGVANLVGNIREWTSSVPEASDDDDVRSIRGGAWLLSGELFGAIYAHPHSRKIQARFSRTGRSPVIGFRCASSSPE